MEQKLFLVLISHSSSTFLLQVPLFSLAANWSHIDVQRRNITGAYSNVVLAFFIQHPLLFPCCFIELEWSNYARPTLSFPQVKILNSYIIGFRESNSTQETHCAFWNFKLSFFGVLHIVRDHIYITTPYQALTKATQSGQATSISVCVRLRSVWAQWLQKNS